MRNNQPRVSDHLAVIEQQIEVERARSPALQPDAAKLILDRLEQIEQAERRVTAVQLCRRIEIGGRIRRPDRSRGMKAAHGAQFDTGRRMEHLQGAMECLLDPTDVSTEGDPAIRHGATKLRRQTTEELP